MSEDWRLLATCREVGWGPAFSADADQRKFADKICRRCPVRRECRDFALKAERGAQGAHRFGVFGGFLGPERAVISRGGAVECVDCCIDMVPTDSSPDRCRVCVRRRRAAKRLAFLEEMALARRGALHGQRGAA